jgi:hypothetical protein
LPQGVAVDRSGSIWVSASAGVYKYSSSGNLVLPVYSFAPNEGGLSEPSAIAIDGAGTVWVADGSGFTDSYQFSQLTQLNGTTGTGISPSTGYIGSLSGQIFSIGIDGSGNLWATNGAAANILEYVGAATPVVTPLAAGVANNTLGTRP